MPEVLATSVAYLSEEESTKLVLSDDHITFNLGSAYVSTFSPYMDSFNFMIRSLREAGLIERWFRNLTAALHTKSDVWRLTAESKTWKPFGQQQLGVAFQLLGIGLAVASCVLIVEAALRRYGCPPRMSEYRVQPRKRN
ncbi:hypothetical protein HPB47_023406 [Ixodes persulcatus]|uniref:Uncharacterized protein n=1 Tax=Ixodes persulcatus TaxID=34615 RepID=A0AC60Q7J3_IXOPE|nr:hypothetical protein HPB47_023406 [Ixodes persulcatus]